MYKFPDMYVDIQNKSVNLFGIFVFTEVVFIYIYYKNVYCSLQHYLKGHKEISYMQC